MRRRSKATSFIRKILGMVLALMLMSGIGVLAVNIQVEDVKIELQNGYELTALTTSKKVSDILEENNIILKQDEKVTPDLDEELKAGDTIKITNKSKKEIEIAAVSEQGTEATTEEILENYTPVVEKIITEDEEIPFETVTKKTTEDTEDTTSKVLQEGENGIVRRTYKVKYQDEEEIERTLISEEVIKEPKERIVQVNKNVTARAASGARVAYSGGKWSYSAAEFDLLCAITAQECGRSYEGALAVISCACNRAASARWSKYGSDPLSQYKAPSQFCYSLDSHWKRFLNGRVPAVVKQAVTDALNGARNHSYLSFRSAGGASGANVIGGNRYF